MEHKYRINKVRGREILDSRGNPTVEVEVQLCGGASGRAAVPSGASTGAFEAVELRDSDLPRYGGNGVKKAVENINETISYFLDGKNALNQVEIDAMMIREDGTKTKRSLEQMPFLEHQWQWQRRLLRQLVCRCISIWVVPMDAHCRFP